MLPASLKRFGPVEVGEGEEGEGGGGGGGGGSGLPLSGPGLKVL